MYYLTLVAYYIYFNSCKVLYGVCLVVLGLFNMYMAIASHGIRFRDAHQLEIAPSAACNWGFSQQYYYSGTSPPPSPLLSSNHSYY
uniref:Uncharacterized protein n=1 Tax=Manihot esculenta TaxID=3983 RepID=A0A2C9VRV3_MANES